MQAAPVYPGQTMQPGYAVAVSPGVPMMIGANDVAWTVKTRKRSKGASTSTYSRHVASAMQGRLLS